MTYGPPYLIWNRYHMVPHMYYMTYGSPYLVWNRYFMVPPHVDMVPSHVHMVPPCLIWYRYHLVPPHVQMVPPLVKHLHVLYASYGTHTLYGIGIVWSLHMCIWSHHVYIWSPHSQYDVNVSYGPSYLIWNRYLMVPPYLIWNNYHMVPFTCTYGAPTCEVSSCHT